MTRCYEFYCAIYVNPSFCEDKSDRTMAYINEYITFMLDKGVKFDKTSEDKELFKKFQDEFGSEKAVTQPSESNVPICPMPLETPSKDMSESGEKLQLVANNVVVDSESIRPLRECAGCGVGSRETQEHKGRLLCPSCLEEEKQRPQPKPSIQQPPITTTITKPKDSWEHRKARMEVPVSKMEQAVLVKLTEKGVHPEVQKEFCLQQTRPDFYFPQRNVAIYLDGEVHKGREDRDEALRELLTKRYNIRVVSIPYEGSSEATEDSIVEKALAILKQA